ncbi:MAG TPA: hypothetical protein DCR78_13525 [Pseudomonas sp.]|uniref:DUF262 domain-containing protein n=1 Tax=Pseudomonas sp. SST3 TaxID=2267882 RepID=UPI000DFB8140|nr:DUF262 domain-containing protein [Pseudomonas sp. SST3]NKQ11060.1 DUF262 domain-containing protein [Pseudomonas sp. SST3]HAQ87448.1 hypothetical protein [Pseudomonas sp.]HAW24541.1 hypothetical protein [Pseudomonas sp.]|tara:strand:- start:357 stop:1766 length:1410 start_codon:yes stop_codon:yes gene_type:complete
MTDLGMDAKQAQQASELSSRIISVYDLLMDTTLEIPQYQRPYKWAGKNINQLFSDIAIHKDKSAYRLGTIVFHREGEKNNIVDGQQRTISLLLAARALIQRCKEKKLERKDLQERLLKLEQVMVNPSFTSEISQKNIHNNYLEVARIVSRADFTEAHIEFFLNKCQVVAVGLTDVSEAFQFFDSQNARGRDLEPHDLLKAYHLREFSLRDEPLKVATVARWENSDTQELATLFSQYLYRIRNWSKGVSARYFSKDDSDLFKGVNIDTVASYPYVEQLRVAHHFVDHYNGQYERLIDSREMGFPFHLDQIIINGRRFFELISHYQSKVARISAESWNGHELVGAEGLDGFAQDIMETINSYPARTRTGDCYVRAMFDCLLIYYLDKFGHAELSRAIEKIFIWAYSLRLQMQVVQLASMDNYVLANNLFRLIKDATRPADFINHPLRSLTGSSSTKTGAIEALFKAMKYYE